MGPCWARLRKIMRTPTLVFLSPEIPRLTALPWFPSGLPWRQIPALGALALGCSELCFNKSKRPVSSPASEFFAHCTCQAGWEGKPLLSEGAGRWYAHLQSSLKGVVFICFPFQFGSVFTSLMSKFVQLWRLTRVCSFQQVLKGIQRGLISFSFVSLLPKKRKSKII